MQTQADQAVRIAASRAPEPETAARELHAALVREPQALVIVFCSPAYDLDELARALAASFAGTHLVGCTTAGEIAPWGYAEETVTAIGFAAAEFRVALAALEPLSAAPMADLAARSVALKDELAAAGAFTSPNRVFGLVLCDGMARREELMMSTLAGALTGIPLFGGSAGDDLHFERARIFTEGGFRADAAVLVLFATALPFQVFTTQHFARTDIKMVVTAADPARRIVHEINAEPAAVEYARIVGVPVTELEPMLFAAHPLLVRIGGADYVRSIQTANPDGSLTFYCAIDEGIVLTLGQGRDLIDHLQELLARLRAELGDWQAILGCDCILRRLESEQRQVKQALSRLLAANRVVGFSTYGEQFASLHVNQTLTGVAIGYRSVGP